MALVLALGLGLAVGMVEVSGTACPSATQVSERLQALLSPRAQGLPRKAELRLHTDQDAALLRVTLRDGVGRVISERELSADAPCADLATAAAVILAAAWDVDPDRGPPAAAPIDLRASSAAPRAPAPPPPGWTWDLSAAAWVSFAGTAAAPAGSVEGFVAPPRRRLGLRLAFLGIGTRDEPVGPGFARWTRIAVSAGPRYSLAKGSFLISLYGEALLAAVLVQGVDFQQNYTSASADLGLGGGVRVGVRLGPVVPFIGGGIAGWLLPQTVLVQGLDPGVTLPRFDLLLGAGVALGRLP
jgi:hypothetical protein